MINDFRNFISQKNSPYTSWQQFLTDFQNFICRVNKFNSSEGTSTGARNPRFYHVPEKRFYMPQNDNAKLANEVETTDCADAVNGKFHQNEEVLSKLRQTIDQGYPQNDEEKELQELGVAQLQESLRKLADELSTLKAENTTLQRKLHSESAEGSRLQSDNDTLNQNLIDNRAENLVLKKENSALKMKLDKKSADLKTMEEQLRKNTADFAASRSLRDKIEKENRLNINKYEKMMDDLNKRLIAKADLLTQKELQAKENEQISNTRISDLRNDKKELKKRLETLTDELDRSGKDNIILKSQISQNKKELKIKTNNLEDRQIQLDNATKKLKKYQQSDLMLRNQISKHNEELERVQNESKVRDQKIEILTKQWEEYADQLIEPEHNLARVTVDLADSGSFRGKSEKEIEIPTNAEISGRNNRLTDQSDNSKKDIWTSKAEIPESKKKLQFKIDDGESKHDKEHEKVKYKLKRSETLRSIRKEYADIDHVLTSLENQTDEENQQWKQRVFSMLSSRSLKDLKGEVNPDVSNKKIKSKGRKKTLRTIEEKEESGSDSDEESGDDIENSTKVEQVRSKDISISNVPVEKPPTTINLDYGIFDMSRDILCKDNS